MATRGQTLVAFSYKSGFAVTSHFGQSENPKTMQEEL
jgi:hypothetical protein